MDRFTRNYSLFLAVLAALLLGWWLASIDTRVWALNGQLADDPELAAYPYAFRVRSLRDGVAAMGSPRSSRLPALRFLSVLDPGLKGRDSNHPDVIAAQRELAHHQGRARKLVLADPAVERVRWVEDLDWYRAHGLLTH